MLAGVVSYTLNISICIEYLLFLCVCPMKHPLGLETPSNRYPDPNEFCHFWSGQGQVSSVDE